MVVDRFCKGRQWSNIVLIGMAGSGKSTVGSLLAARLGMNFVDTDTLIEVAVGRSLQEIVDDRGPSGLRRVEEDVLLSVQLKKHVIATGGSSVYSQDGMAHLRRDGICILLDVAPEMLEKRIKNMSTRGLVRYPGQSFKDLYEERRPLYLGYADIRLSCTVMDAADVAELLVRRLEILLEPGT